MLKHWIVAAGLLLLPACAAVKATPVAASKPSDPIAMQLQQLARNDLECPSERLSYEQLGELDSVGPWRAHGCGRQAMYQYYKGFVRRTTVIVDSAETYRN